MEILDKIPGIIGYAVVSADDGKVEEVKGSSATALADLTAYFSSAGEVIKNSLDMGELKFVSITYGSNRLVIVPYESKYVGFEMEQDKQPQEILEHLKVLPTVTVQSPVQVPRNLASKVHQINLLIDEFGGESEREHWFDLLNQSLSVLGREVAPILGVVEDNLAFKESPPDYKEDDFTEALRYVVDFLVKKAVEEMGSSQARAKVQAVIEKMR
jgi:hypothetical protein